MVGTVTAELWSLGHSCPSPAGAMVRCARSWVLQGETPAGTEAWGDERLWIRVPGRDLVSKQFFLPSGTWVGLLPAKARH